MRTVEQTAAPVGSNITVTVTFTNANEGEVRGYFYSEQLPSAVDVVSSVVQISGRSVTNYLFERGLVDDVYAGYVPVRWAVEEPTNFLAGNSLPPGSSFKLTYSLSCSTTGLFKFGDEGYAGYIPTNGYSFGATVDSNPPAFAFLSREQGGSLVWQKSSNEVIVCVNGEPGMPYVLDASGDLRSWDILKTNLSPFTWVDRTPSPDRRFYRGRALAAAVLAEMSVAKFAEQWRISLAGVPGAVYVVETSSNLVTWTAMVTNSSPFSFLGTDLAGGQRFYRGRWLP
jgi:hypothetical protein